MVKKLSQSDKAAIAQAIAAAEAKTSAELACVVAPASDAYHAYVVLYGLALGSAVALVLWLTQTVTFYPLLLMIQLGAICALMLAPLTYACILVPRRHRYRRAAHRAFEEYLLASRHFPGGTPVVALYVSLAERYAHIIPSRTVRAKIPDAAWDGLMQNLLANIPSLGVRQACVEAIGQAGVLLAAQFPD